MNKLALSKILQFVGFFVFLFCMAMLHFNEFPPHLILLGLAFAGLFVGQFFLSVEMKYKRNHDE